MTEIATTAPESMTDEEILAEYDSFPSQFDDLETYKKAQVRKSALASAYNSRGQSAPTGAAARSRRILA